MQQMLITQISLVRAGYGATTAYNSNFGNYAGYQATNAYNSNFFGLELGKEQQMLMGQIWVIKLV
jgi:hypothetical protein